MTRGAEAEPLVEGVAPQLGERGELDPRAIPVQEARVREEAQVREEARVAAPARVAEGTRLGEEAGGARRVVISAAGDLVLNALAMRSVRAHPSEEDGYAALLDGYARSIRQDEIAYLNLEVPLRDDLVPLAPGWPRSRTERPRASPVLGATPALATVLARIGVDVVGVANNHAYDQGNVGMARTLAALEGASIAYAGAASSEQRAYDPIVIERGGVRVAWISFTTSFNQRGRDRPRTHVAHVSRWERIERALAIARASAEVVVVAVHWSSDFVMHADREQRSIAARLIALGADVVLGTGPHVLHEVARAASARGDAVIAYSLGNVASGMGRAYRHGHPPDLEEAIHPANVRPEARDGLVLRVAIELEGEAIRVDSIEGVALWTENDFLAHTPRGDATIRVVPLAEVAPEVRAEREPAIRSAIGAGVELVP